MWQFDYEKLADDLKGAAVELDCPTISLQQNKDSAPVFRGPGIIRFGSSERISFKLFSDRPLPKHRDSSTQAGDLVPDSEFYTLAAADAKGRNRKALVYGASEPYGASFGSSNFVIVGDVHQLRSTEALEFGQNERLILDIYEDIEIPCNDFTETRTVAAGRIEESRTRNLAVFEANGLSFHLENRDGRLRIEARAHQLPAHLDLRVVESLQFVLARTVSWTTSYQESENERIVRVRPSARNSASSHIQPPIQFHGSIDATNSIWPLFSKYLGFVLPHTADRWHPVSELVHSVIEASAGSLDAERLALAVAVEGVAGLLFPELGKPDAEFDAARDDLLQHVKRWPGREGWQGERRFRERVHGLFGLLARAGAKQRLSALASKTAIDEADLLAWERVRHSAAHADRSDAIPTQELLNLMATVTAILYKLIFQAIGYAGKRSNYAARGWPIVDYVPADLGNHGELGTADLSGRNTAP